MKPLPNDPWAFQARTLKALCDDLFDLGAGKSRKFERLDALHHISTKETRVSPINGGTDQ